MESRHLLIIIRQFWPLAGPGQLAAADLACELLRQGQQVEIATARLERSWPEKFQIREIPVTRISKPSIGPWSSYRYQRSLAHHLSENPAPDGVIVFGLDEDIATASRVLGPSVPVVARVDYRITPYHQWPTKLTRKTRFGLERAQIIVADSDFSRKRLVEEGIAGEKIQVQPDHVWVDPDAEFSTSRRDAARRSLSDAHPILAIDSNQLMAVTGAAMDGDEGVIDLVKAWPRVMRSIPGAKLWILGDGPESGKIWNLIRSLNLMYSVILPGFFDEPGELLQAADLYVHPLRSNRACSFLLRAMSEAACPIVTSTEFTSQYCHADENALVVPPQNPDALAEAIIHAADQSAIRERLGARARQMIATAAPIESAARLYLDWLARAPRIGCAHEDDFLTNELE